MSASVGRRRAALGLMILWPLIWLGPALGSYKVPGLPTGMLYGQLSVGQGVRMAGQTGDLQVWPENLVLSLAQGLLGGLFGDGLVVGVGVFLGLIGLGIGGWSLVRAAGGNVTSALSLGLLLQLSPPTIRAVRSGELGWLALGPALWALARCMEAASGRGWTVGLALVAGAWSPAGAFLVAVMGIRYRWLLLGVLPWVPALLSDPSTALGAARLSEIPPLAATGVVSESLALFPSGAGFPSTESGPLGLNRLPGGLGLWGLGLVGMAMGRRVPGALGLALLIAWTGVFGWLPDRGAPPSIPHPWLESVSPWIPGLRPPVGTLAWLMLAIPPLSLSVARRVSVVWLLPVGALALVLEGAEPVVPVTNLGPDPALSVLPHLPAGPVQLFPNTQTAGREGSRTPEEMNYHLGRQARELAEPEQALLLQGYLAHLSGTELPLARAEELWSSRTADPILQAREDGVVGLILDHRSISLESLERMESWLVVRVGEALAVSADWSVYRLEPLESP